jgi:hypothetical protein
LLPGRCLISNGVPELGKPRQLGMRLVDVQEIDRWINNSVERAVVGRTWASGAGNEKKKPISIVSIPSQHRNPERITEEIVDPRKRIEWVIPR